MATIENPTNITPAVTPETPPVTPEVTPETPETPETPPTEAKLFGSVVPEEFKDRPYLKDILEMEVGEKGYGEVFKKLDGAQKLIGKKATPDSTSTPEEWTEYYSKMRPETSEAYELTIPEGETANEEVVKEVKDIFFKAGLTKQQASTVHDEFNTLMAKQAEAMGAKGEEQDVAFEELTKSTFGEDVEGKMKTAKTMLNELAPENVKPYVEKLSNEALVVLAGILNSVHSKYGVEGKKLGGEADLAGVSTLDSLEKEGRALMALPEYRNTFHENHPATLAKVNDIYARIGKLRK